MALAPNTNPAKQVAQVVCNLNRPEGRANRAPRWPTLQGGILQANLGHLLSTAVRSHAVPMLTPRRRVGPRVVTALQFSSTPSPLRPSGSPAAAAPAGGRDNTGVDSRSANTVMSVYTGTTQDENGAARVGA